MDPSFEPYLSPWEYLSNHSEKMIRSNETDALFFANISAALTPAIQIRPYYGDQLAVYRDFYSSIHGYISIIVCIFGITANVMNIVVLTRKGMICPINVILTGLAVADCMVMLSYVPFSFHNYLRFSLSEREKYTFGWAVFTLFHAHFTVVNHTIATWLTVTVAIWRVMTVCYPTQTMRHRGLFEAKIAVGCTYLACALFCIPSYMSFTVKTYYDAGNHTLYRVNLSELGLRHGGLLASVNFWIFSVVSKLVPCVALTACSFALLKVLYKADQRRQRMNMKSETTDKSQNRTTKMLLAVLFLFLFTQFPTGMLALLTGALGEGFFENVYLNFGETMDIVSLVNSAVNFIIYCTMSRQFRDTFKSLFLEFSKEKWAPVPGSEQTQQTAVGTACL